MRVWIGSCGDVEVWRCGVGKYSSDEGKCGMGKLGW